MITVLLFLAAIAISLRVGWHLCDRNHAINHMVDAFEAGRRA